MNKSLLLKYVKHSNLNSTTKSFLFSVIKNDPGQNNTEGTESSGTAQNQQSQPDYSVFDPLFDPYIENTGNKTKDPYAHYNTGVEDSDRVLEEAGLGTVDREALHKIQPWEDIYTDILNDKMMDGIPFSAEEEQMARRLDELARFRKEMSL